MKNLSIVALAVLTGLASCQKSAVEEAITESATTETVSVDLESGSTYDYNLGDRTTVSSQISSQASHASLSRIAIVPTSSSSTYQYVSDSTFTGSDSVIVTMCSPKKNHCGNNGGPDSIRMHKKFRFHIKPVN